MKFRILLGLSIVKVISLVLFAGSALAAEVSGYELLDGKDCDGFPQVQVSTKTGCLGLVLGKDEPLKMHLKMPRYAVQGSDGTIYVSDMGGWAFGKGSIYALRFEKEQNGQNKVQVTDLFPNKKLNLPNGLAMDPEGRLYIGTPMAVFRFMPLQLGKFKLDASLEVVVDGFAKSVFRREEFQSEAAYNSIGVAKKNRHPLLQLAANANFTELYINIGAPSDDCAGGLHTVNSVGQCIQSESELASAAVWRVQLSDNSERKVLSSGVFARGLRNSMALVVHSSGNVLQGENGIDLPGEDFPYEEINWLQEGKHYGWPYCHSNNQVSPKFIGKVAPENCQKKYTSPVVFMPAHVAPLSFLYYQGSLLPELNNKLLVSWHGYRKNGQRIVGYEVGSNGLPTSNQYQEVVFGWEAKSGVRPRGTPVGLTELADGSVLILDDRNGAILRLSSGTSAEEELSKEHETKFSQKSLDSFAKVTPFVKAYCSQCHTQFQKASTAEMLQEMKNGMLDLKNPWQSHFYLKLQSQQMPPEGIRESLGFKPSYFDQVLPLVREFIQSLEEN